MNWKALFLLSLFCYGAYHTWQTLAVTHGTGIVAADTPIQNNLGGIHTQNINGYQITLLAEFNIQARVLSRKNYSVGREADLSLVDFALGWGPMSDEAVLNKIDISQSNRFYFWHVDAFPIPREAIETHSANMHMMAIDASVARTLRSVRVGQIVHIDGFLIEATAVDGWRWKSSLTRNDTGKGACELLLVKRIDVR